MQTTEITLEAFQSAPEYVSERGRKKGMSETEKTFRGWYENENGSPVLQFSDVKAAAIRQAVNRTNGTDSNLVSDYENSLRDLGIIGKELARVGSGNDQTLVIAFARASALATGNES